MNTPPGEFRYAYRHGSLECRLHVRTEDGRAVTSFITCEPGQRLDAEPAAHMATSIAHAKMDWMAEATVLADRLLSEVFQHASVGTLRPMQPDHARLRDALSQWLHTVRDERTQLPQATRR